MSDRDDDDFTAYVDWPCPTARAAAETPEAE